MWTYSEHSLVYLASVRNLGTESFKDNNYASRVRFTAWGQSVFIWNHGYVFYVQKHRQRGVRRGIRFLKSPWNLAHWGKWNWSELAFVFVFWDSSGLFLVYCPAGPYLCQPQITYFRVFWANWNGAQYSSHVIAFSPLFFDMTAFLLYSRKVHKNGKLNEKCPYSLIRPFIQ